MRVPFFAFGVGMTALGFWSESAFALQNIAVELVPYGDAMLDGNQTVRVEVFLTVLNQEQSLRSFEVDFPCTLEPQPGAVGVVGNDPAAPNPVQGRYDAWVLMDRMGSLGGVPFLFPLHQGGWGFSHGACRFWAFMVNPDPPVLVPAGQTRYLGTVVYRAQECAVGDFRLQLEPPYNPEMPTTRDSTKFRDGSYELIPWKPPSPVNVTVRSGACCLGGVCLDGVNGFCCQEVLAGTLWMDGASCETFGCPCRRSRDCEDGNPCTDHACVNYACVTTENENRCEDGSFCTVGDVCVQGRCVGRNDACPGQLCDETNDRCVQCFSDRDCPATNDPCLVNVCAGGTCERQCQSGRRCSDGLFCTVLDACNCADPRNPVCVGTPGRCAQHILPICDEERDRCVQCTDASHCDDADPCTSDFCNGARWCMHEPIAGGAILAAEPPSGTLDARMPYLSNDEFPPALQGIGGVDEPVRLTIGVPGVPAECYRFCETTADPIWGANAIALVSEPTPGVHELVLMHPIAAGAVTTIGIVHGPHVAYTSNPANVDADGLTGVTDLLKLVDYLNETQIPPFGPYSTDIDHNGQFNGADVMALLDLLNGDETHTAWLGTPRPTNTLCR